MDVFGATTVAKDVHVLVEEVTSLNFLILDFFGTSVHQLFSSKMTQQSFCALSPAEAKGAQGGKGEGGLDKGGQSALEMMQVCALHQYGGKTRVNMTFLFNEIQNSMHSKEKSIAFTSNDLKG